MAVLAGPGYGKTTLIAQWADADERPFAWVSLDERDNDAVVFLTYIAAALDRVEPIPPVVFEGLSSAGAGIETVLVPRLAAALSRMTVPLVLVLDDVHALRNRACLDAMAMLVSSLPAGSQIALAGRAEPELPLARLRAQHEVLDIGPVDLAFGTGEADVLLRANGVRLSEADVAGLVERTEGWPIGLYLAALAIEAAGESSIGTSVAGDDAVLADYLRSEVLDRQSPKIASFLTRTSVLDEVCGSICDAVLGEKGSTRTLESIARQNLLVVPVDRRQEWFRYHQFFRELLLFDLHQRDPELAPELRRTRGRVVRRERTARGRPRVRAGSRRCRPRGAALCLPRRPRVEQWTSRDGEEVARLVRSSRFDRPIPRSRAVECLGVGQCRGGRARRPFGLRRRSQCAR